MEELSETPQASQSAETRYAIVIVGGGMHHAILTLLEDQLPDERLLLSGEKLTIPPLEDEILRLKPEEMIVKIAAPDVVQEERGRNRRRDWESPYGNPSKNRPRPAPVRNLKQMLRYRGGR